MSPVRWTWMIVGALVAAPFVADAARGKKAERGESRSEAKAQSQAPGAGPAEEDGPGEVKDSDEVSGFNEPPIVLPVLEPKVEARQPAAPPSKGHSALKISGVLFDGPAPGEPDPEEAIRLTNSDLEHPLDISDFALSDTFGPPRNPIAPAHSDSNAPRFVSFPAGTRIGAGKELWVAYNGRAFERLFGFKPDFEGQDSLAEVPQIEMRTEWPTWNSLHGVVSLHDAFGNLVDVVPYERGPNGDQIDKFSLPKGSWSGPSVLLFRASPFAWTGQVLARDRDQLGHLVPDTDSAADWDGGFSRQALGSGVVHRVEYPGQSRFSFPRLEGVEAEITAASAPENAFAALNAAVEGAKKEILVRIYQFENDLIADLFVAAKKRGVEVTVYCEGSPVGGLPDQERYIVERLHQAGIPVWFLVTNERERVRNRYRFDHSKYLIVDGELAIVATENFGYSGHPVDPSYGNRGWMLHVRNRAFAQQLRQIWDADLDPKHHLDLVEVAQDPSDNWGFPYKKPPFNLRRSVIQGSYPLRRPPLRVKGKVNLELVACPDNCLSEGATLLGVIQGAQKSLFVLENSIPLWWGKKNGGDPETTPNLPLQAVIDAARRGVRVRVLLDGTWYNTEAYDPRDNDDTVRFLNELAQKERLDLEAKVVNLVSTSLEKIHAKGVIADGQRTVLSSINWTENSFKGNREIGVVVDQPEVATYYTSLFQRDWNMTRLYRAKVADRGGSVLVRPAEGSQVLKKVAAGALLDVMAENNNGFLEVRLSEKATGYLASGSVEEIVAVPEEAAALVGRSARVVGKVKGTHVAKGGVYLNFGVNWRSDFSVLIPREALGAFQAAGVSLPADYEGREVEVRGALFDKDGPAMRLEAPGLIEVVR